MDERARRVVQNEALFRRTNEEVERLADELSDAVGVSPPDRLTVVCECADIGCAARLHVARSIYERARADSGCFIVKPGHEVADLERVVDETDEYMIVTKASVASTALAKRTDRRT
jgi:hypothetical protein